MAKPSPLTGLMSFSLHVSRDFETIGYVQFHVVWVWLQVLRKKRQFFITQFTIQTLFSKTNFNWLSRTMSQNQNNTQSFSIKSPP